MDHTTEHARAQLERLTFFSDAVFAIAMTLLVIEVKVPVLHGATDAELGHALLALTPQYIGFFVSFLVLGRFWMIHHRVMGFLRGVDTRLILANLGLLLAVAFMPFATAIFSDYVMLRVGAGFYTAWLVVLGIANLMVSRAGLYHRRLARADVSDTECARELRIGWTAIIIGVAAFAVGMVRPMLSPMVLVVGSPVVSHWLSGRGKIADSAGHV